MVTYTYVIFTRGFAIGVSAIGEFRFQTGRVKSLTHVARPFSKNDGLALVFSLSMRSYTTMQQPWSIKVKATPILLVR